MSLPDHDFLVWLAKTFGLGWLLGFFILAAIFAYAPSRRAAHERAGRSILPTAAEEDKP